MVIDFYHISTSLGDDANRQVGAELARLANGPLPGPGRAAAGKDYLSQFWVGTLLAQSKLEPRILAFDRQSEPKPDFLIKRGSVSFAVEIKRPVSSRSARRAIATAGGQLRRVAMPGIIVIDATDCLAVDPWAILEYGSGAGAQRAIEVANLHNTFQCDISSYSRSSKFSQTAMLFTFARYWNWVRDERGEPVRNAGLLFHAFGFPYLWSSQITNLTGQIQEQLIEGVRQLTGRVPNFHYS